MMRKKSGPHYKYTDLERYRLEYFVNETKLSIGDMAKRIGRTKGSVESYLNRIGISVREERNPGSVQWSS